MARLYYIAKDGMTINGYGIRKNEMVNVTHINIEVGKRVLMTFTDMYNNTHAMDDKAFHSKFKFDRVLD